MDTAADTVAMTSNITFGARLKITMGRLNMTQARLSELTEIHPSEINRYVMSHRVPTPGRAKRLAAALGVNASYLMFG